MSLQVVVAIGDVPRDSLVGGICGAGIYEQVPGTELSTPVPLLLDLRLRGVG